MSSNERARTVLGITDSITSGAALVQEGRIVAAVAEERLNRMKMSMGWPRLAIQEVLRIAGVEPQDIDRVAVATETLFWRPEAEPLRSYFDGSTWSWDKKLIMSIGSFGSACLGNIPAARLPYYWMKGIFCRHRRPAVARELAQVGVNAPITYVDHHLAHAASAYYTGGEPDANVVTLDGAGDNLSATVYRGHAGELECVARVSSYDSIGNFYSYVTHILGFKAHQHEGKITGLAAYGKPIYADIFRRLIRHRQGRIENRARAFHHSAIRKIRRLLPDDADRADVACSIQLVLEEVCVDFVRYWAEKLGHRHLGLAGGVPANVKLNQRIFALDEVPSMYVHPGMGDDGLAVGAALHESARGRRASERAESVYRIQDVYLGPEFDGARVRKALEDAHLPYSRPDNLAAEVAQKIHEGKVVARFDGRMEYGPRALGNRSILVHAGDPTVNDWLNKRVQRTEFMPFAPVTLLEEVEECYVGLEGVKHSAEFMTITCDCTEKLSRDCPAVVHVDGTARPQLVGPASNPGYRAILEEYRNITGFSTIINTSFNMHEEPIVCTPEDAVRAFTLGHLDYLVAGEFLVANPNPVPEKESPAAAAAGV